MAMTEAGTRTSDPVFGDLVAGAIPKMEMLSARRFLKPFVIKGNPEEPQPLGRTGKIYVEHSSSFLGDPTVGLKRPPGGQIQAIHMDDPSTVSYACTARSARTPRIPKEHMRGSQIGSLKKRGAKAVGLALGINEDVELDRFITGASWTGTSVLLPALTGGGGTRWDQANPKIMQDLDAMRSLVRNASSGIDPNSLFVPVRIADYMRRDPGVRGYFVATQGASFGGDRLLTEDKLVAILRDSLGFSNIEIGHSRKRTNNPGQTTATDHVFGNGLWMGHIANEAEVSDNGSINVTPTALAMVIEQDVEGNIEWDWETQSWTAWADESFDMIQVDSSLGIQVLEVLTP